MSRSVQLTFVLLVISFCTASGQVLKDVLAKGDRYFAKKDFEDALSAYLEAYKLAPDDAETNFKVGVTYLHTEQKFKGLAFLEKAYHTHPEVDADIEYHLGMAYQYDHQYGKAKEHYTKFKEQNKKFSDIANHKIAECIVGDSLSRHPAYVEIKNVGTAINTNFHEYSPLLADDGRMMIFSSNRSTDDYKIKSGSNFEDIYVSYRQGELWSTPKKISENINTKYNDAAASLSHDGKTLFLYYEAGAGDIYVSKFDGNDWSKPVPLNKNINTPLFWETSACLSPDGKKLYFTSNRPGGKGELDIYVSELDASGNWGKAVNLGPTINTPLNEDAPFIHADGATLYFSSDGHPTMGSNDIFKTELKDGKWSKPVNLGYPINSIEYDGFFTLSADKKTAYYSAMRADGLGNADIYQITFLDPPKKPEHDMIVASAAPVIDEPKPLIEKKPTDDQTKSGPTTIIETEVPKEEIKPIKSEENFVDPIVELHRDMKIVTVLKGKVIDEKTSLPLSAKITLLNNETNEVVARMSSHAETGDFELVIPHGGNYGVATEVAGYLFNSINFNLPQFAEFQEIDTHILMVKAEVGSKVILKNIFFDIGKADLKPESLGELENIRKLLVSNGHLKVQINGHTDNTGNAASNKVLSLHRAESVVKYLVSQGIDASRLTAKGFGSERPLVSNDDETEGREINRRTEIEITEANQ
jgi:outer membrane protein OmpA-like peptidoglycan-associated protein